MRGGLRIECDFDDGDQANIELDLYGGLKGTVGSANWQGGVIYYAYPGAKVGGVHYDYLELAGKLGYDFGFFTATAGLNYSGDYFFKTGTGVYVSGDVSVPLPKFPFDMGIGLHVGHQWIENNARFGTPDYTDWSIGVSGKIEGFTISLQYVDTSIDGAACFPGSGLTSTCDARGVLSVSRTF
ncbi:MAG: hypothetical protein EXQ88_06265 [Alphaproteobacteria bacterium]|nr:hypothetical protein [Alphaproteobacteria bacterium]